ncbi:GDP/GTP exchange factor sec2p domain-containing protein [Hirsutella rhossiliensis]|uniref:GDP/GTP exchange factor sec2p domain-containing protein n=1 Tax=Hirsutella rhossiliensis TaxID=111463 RepID=A0A9P8MPQ6_9HYPO|nr:GDP/GTP exchange factor sec2p domain-containing protein [Hirsutella rhossiliensis]KAH0958884.1 GDP/GTP exchange factor sec2p domain-containing protein [Hirsutella rhossiliensis]
MSTLPDPRSRCAPSPAGDKGSPDSLRHPDLDDELATLSAKLVNAINHQTFLDDTLSATRHELQAARERIRELESESQSHLEKSKRDVWIRRSSLDAERKAMQAEKKKWQARLAEETSKRLDTEKEKRKIEQELENLTTALFEEANKMVIAAKEEAQLQNEALQRKNEQLKSQLADSESLLKSQQEQLSQLKAVMESMASERDDMTNGTTPPSPGISRLDSAADDDRPPPEGLPAGSPSLDGCSPCNPTSLQHLVQPVLRTDLASYDDFMALARISQQRRGSRVSSGSLGGITALALGLGGSTSSAHPSNASTTSLGASTPAPNSAPQSPNTPASSTSVGSPTAPGTPTPNLKDTRFYKRILADDVEPTLRLDAAPGLSWLARRSVLASVTDGSLIVEPVPDSATYMAIVKPHHHPCSLCGESRKSPEHLRNHRFRTSESVSAQRYALCSYCLNRVRSTCDFLGFLRLVRDGHWRAEDEDSEKAAWEESVKLREQMFWARVGGGVVPASQVASPAPAETDKESRPSQDHLGIVEETETGKMTPDGVRHADDADSKNGASRQGTEHIPREPRTPPDRMDGNRSRRDSVERHAT